MLLFWGLGTGAPVAGLVVVAILALTVGDISLTKLAVVVLVLGGVVLCFGLLVTWLNARAVVAPILSVRDAMERVGEGDLDAEVQVYDGTELGQLQAGFNQMVAGLREREQLRDLFGRHVGRDVAEAATSVTSSWVARPAWSRCCSSTSSARPTMATEREPAEVVELLNRFFGVVVEEVDRHSGLVNKFIGDAVLAVFGAPVELDDHATRALAAARAMAARLAEEVPDLEAGIGVATGEAVAGNVGDESRFEYTVIGDAVNAAARITDLAKKVDGRLLAALGVGGGCRRRRGRSLAASRDGHAAGTQLGDRARRTEGVRRATQQHRDRARPRAPVSALTWGPADGPLALLLHGFPDSAHTWRHLGPVLADEGYRVVAPFTRGYAPSGVPTDGRSDVGALMADAVGVHAALDGGARRRAGRARLGRDHRQRAGRAPRLAVPPRRRRWRCRRSRRCRSARPPLLPGQARRSWYIGFNQLPTLPERSLDRLVPKLWRDWSPGYDATVDVAHTLEALPDTAHRRAAVNYYRHLARPVRVPSRYRRWQAALRDLPGDAAALPARPRRRLHDAPASPRSRGRTCRSGSEVRVVDRGGHFLHLEQPDRGQPTGGRLPAR